MSPSIMLDTNIFVHLIRADRVGQQVIREFSLLTGDDTPSFCVVTEGELRSLTYQFNWGEETVEKMRFLIDFFHRLPIDSPETLEAYAAIDAYSKRAGVTMGKNDLWIAAVSHVSGTQLITTDRDFDHLNALLLNRTLIELPPKSS